jgi:hypothetical protein
MPTVSKALFRGAATTSNTTLYTVPNTSTTTVVTNIVIANTAAATSTATINIDSVALASGVSLAPNSVTTIDLKQVIPANATPKTISGSAGATTVNFHISGVEIS